MCWWSLSGQAAGPAIVWVQGSWPAPRGLSQGLWGKVRDSTEAASCPRQGPFPSHCKDLAPLPHEPPAQQGAVVLSVASLSA